MKKGSFSNIEVDILRQKYPHMSTIELAKEMKRDLDSVYRKAYALGLKKTAEYMQTAASGRYVDSEPGKATRFKKGHMPWNAGMKGLQIGGEETRFKKGNEPHNTKHDGAITIRTDNNGKDYKHIRVAKAKWMPLHRYLWQQENGQIPKGHNIAFKDGNTLNCTLDNLELISNYELMQRNSIHNYPDEIRLAAQLRGVLNRKINQLEKEHE